MSKTRLSTFLMTILAFFIWFPEASAQSPALEQEQLHFDKMANYLIKGSGKWTGENKNHDPANPKSPKAFGLWFDRPLQNLLNIKIVAYLEDTILISSQGAFSWHPTKNQYVHTIVDRGNGYSEGISEFPNDSSFISTMVIYRPSGEVYDHKDENFIVNEDEHRNVSFTKDESGEWKEKGNWIWKRDPAH